MTAALGLIVPVRLDALLIGAIDAREDSYFAAPYANFSNLPYIGSGRRTPYLASLAVQQPFTGNAPLAQGIHLHWQLPRALRVGAYGNDGALSIPKAPDRWLITRIIADAGANPSPSIELRSWVVESNYLDVNGSYSPTTIPWAPSASEPPQTYRYLGRVYDYEAWLAGGGSGTYWDNLTAVGYGIPDFAASYPNCRMVFGFADTSLNNPTFDPQTKAIAYSVTGWYSNPADDPLYGQSIDGSSNPYGWIFSAPPGESPEYTLCQGFVYALNWRPQIAYLPGYAVPIAPEIAIGNTPSDAFGALAATKVDPVEFPNAQTVLDALQLGVLPYLDQPGGTARLEEALYNDTFNAAPGGTVWQLEPKESGGTAEAKAALEATDETLATALERLNETQRTYDAGVGRALSLQVQIFADWNKYMLLRYPNPAADINAVFRFLYDEVSALNTLAAELATLETDIAAQQQAVIALLPAELNLAAVSAPRYYEPDDPVLVLSGDQIPAPPPDSHPSANCILTSQLLSQIALPAELVPGSAAATLAASQLPAVTPAASLPYAAIAQLAPAMMLADPQLAPVLTAILAASGGAQNPAVLDPGTTSAAIASAQTSLIDGQPPANGIAFTGALPQTDIGFLQWAIPWHPIALSWRFEYTPLAGSEGEIPSSWILDNFTFDTTSFDLQPNTVTFGTALQQYSGTTLLSPDATISLQRQIASYLQYVDDPELRELLEDLGAFPILAQSLGGFDASLLMLALILQLPVADPAATDQFFADFSNITVRNAVGPQNKMAPLISNTYNPFRAGRLKLTELRLTDEFGRFRTVNLDDVIVAETIPVLPTGELLPPLRITQPSRLDLRWLSAADGVSQSSAVPVSGPICGWVVPNHLDDSLAFYDATGAAIGSLTRSGDSTRTIWLNAPGLGTPSQTMEEAFAGRNAVLTAFAFSVRDNGPAYIGSLIRTIDRTRVFIAPQNEQQNLQTSVLIGAPLAIVQAHVGLQLLGYPSPDQSNAALRADIARGNPLERSVHNFPNVRFPVILGSLSEFDDGLIGYFLPGANGADFNTLYAAAANGDDAHIVQPAAETLTIAAADAATTLTMLVDPRAGVHAFTGIAPVKILTIPPDWTAAALRAMSYTFLTTPIVTLGGGVGLPIPAQIPNATWSWVEYASGGAWVETAIADLNLEATLQTPTMLREGWMKLLRG